MYSDQVHISVLADKIVHNYCLYGSQLRPSMAEAEIIFRLQDEINSVRNDTLDYADLDLGPMAGETLNQF